MSDSVQAEVLRAPIIQYQRSRMKDGCAMNLNP